MMKRFCLSMLCIVFVAFCMATGVCAEDKGGTKALNKTYEEKNLGFSILYPDGWVYTSQSAHVVVFTPQKGKTGNPTVSVQNLNTTKVQGGRFQDVDAVIDDLANQLRVAKDVRVYETTVFTYSKGEAKLAGKQLTAEYVVNKERYKQWIVVVPRGAGDVIHVWSFTCPAKSYESNLETAKAMLGSWTLK